MMWPRPARVLTRWTLIGVCLVHAIGRAAGQQTATVNGSINGSTNGFLLVALPSLGVYQAAMVEIALTSALGVRFPSASQVRCVDMRATNGTTSPAANGTRFDLLFLVGDNPIANSSAVANTSSLVVNSTELQTNLTTSLAPVLLNGTLSIRRVAPADVVSQYGALPALGPVAAPPAGSGAAFMRVDVSFRNLLSPLNLTQSLVYQTRRGMQTFLGLTSLAQVSATGPAQVPPSSVLLLTQSYWLVLNNNASDATMDNRQRLANLLIYGDPSRLTSVDPSTPRPSMFLDYAVVNEPAIDPTVLLTLPYVFSSLSVDVFPAGNPAAPEPTLPPGTVVIPATPTDQLLARVRKRHIFAFASNNAMNATTTSPLCPTLAGGGICVKMQWNNTLDGMPFWLESIESLETLTWNWAPATLFCAARDTPLPLLASPTVPSGSSDAVWAFAPITTATTRVAFALNLRSLDDNATRVQVEISADIRSAYQAATTVTSIARRVGDSSTDAPPIYTTRSNVVVAYDSRFTPSTNEIALSLTLQASEITQKDTSQPCAHCQNLYEWCAAHAACQALANCVFRDGLEAAQVPATLLQSPSLADAFVDVSLYTRRCLTSQVDLDALLLFASAVRCQLRRQCAVRTAKDYALVGLDDRVLLWEAGDGVVQLHANLSTNTSVQLRLRDTPLCSFAPAAFAASPTPRELEDFVMRQCTYANHLGRVTVATAPLANATSSSSSNATALELRFQDLVGELPFIDTADGSPVVATALPTLRLRLERTDFATALPPLPPTPTPTSAEICQSTCRALALDVCLRNLQCVAITDCITRFSNSSTASTGDALLQLFERRKVGESLSLQAAVTQCEPAASDTNATRAWRQLGAASACYAKYDCALSLQGVVLPPAPDGDAVVGKWRFRPTPTATQRLFFEQQVDDADPSGSVVPLVASDSQPPRSSPTDAATLTSAWRSLLQFDGVDVRVVANSTDTPTGRRSIQWEIAYSYWLGRLPRVVDTALAPRWRLVDMPSGDVQDLVVEMVATSNSTNATDASSTMSVMEVTAAMTDVSG